MELVFLLNLNSDYGGGDYSIFKFAEALSKLNNKVVIFYTGNKRVSIASRTNNFIVYSKYHFPLKLKGKGIINNIIGYFYDTFYLYPYLNNNKNNINYIVGYQIHSAIKADDLAGKYGLKKINFIFETPLWLIEKWSEWKTVYENNIKVRMEWAKYQECLKNADIIIANSNLTSIKTKEWIGKSADLIMYPGIPENIKTEDSTKKKNQILFIGRLESNKNIDEIIKALSLLKTDLKLVIIGTGNEENRLKQLAIKNNVNVDFQGKVSDRKKWEEIEKSLLMVFPSSFEGFGMPPMEALLMKTPCICSDIPILKEVYSDSVDYFEEHNIKQLSDKISELISNPHLIEQKGEKGYQYIKRSFGWDRSAKVLNEFLNKSIEIPN